MFTTKSSEASVSARSGMSVSPYLKIFGNRRIAVVLFLGFSSGLPLALTSGTLQAWMTVAGVDIATIGLFSLVGLPYLFKFLWAPVMDRFVPPLLGRRRGWIVLMQIALAAGIFVMASLDPAGVPVGLAALALLVAFLSASQDIVYDAYRTDVLREKERGAGAAVSVLGYRAAMLVSGALALIIADQIGWHATYSLMAMLMLALAIATVLGPEPEVPVKPPARLIEAIAGPLKDFFSRKDAWSILVLIVLYKLGDAFAGTLTTAFLLRGVGFSLTDVGAINKTLGLIATIVGALFGGALMVKLGLLRSLLLFGILQALSNLSFMVLAWIGKSYPVMVAAVGFENFSGGMGTAAFVALLMGLCNPRFSATQFALLSAAASVGRVLVGPPAGYIVKAIGWADFFFLTFLVALPGLLLLWWLRGTVASLSKA
jgi:MFS transporter, PAT family, beta-lactamase induction signal transducer AmpG